MTAIVELKLGRSLMHQKRYAEAEQETSKAYSHFAAHSDENASYLKAAQHDLAEISAHLNSRHQAQNVTTTVPPSGTRP